MPVLERSREGHTETTYTLTDAEREAIVAALTRRRLLTAIPALGLIAATGLSCDDDSTPTPTAAPTTRTITNKFGTYEIPLEPQRLMLMENRVELEAAVALGLTPVSVGNFFTFEGGPAEWVAPWVPFTPADQVRFESFAVGIEDLLALAPDLILSDAFWLEAEDPPARNFNALKDVAPVIPLNLLPWREDLQQVAGWLGREDRLAETLAAFDALRDDIKARHAERIQNARVAYGSFESPSLYLRTLNEERGPATRALAELGGQVFPTGIAEDPAFPGSQTLSMENLSVIEDADAILIWAPDAAQRAELLAHPLWNLLPAVQAGRAVVSPQNVGSGYVYTVMECLRLWDQVYSTLG